MSSNNIVNVIGTTRFTPSVYKIDDKIKEDIWNGNNVLDLAVGIFQNNVCILDFREISKDFKCVICKKDYKKGSRFLQKLAGTYGITNNLCCFVCSEQILIKVEELIIGKKHEIKHLTNKLNKNKESYEKDLLALEI